MNEFMAMVAVRGIIALAGLLCVYWGYRLFYVSTERQGQISVSTGEKQTMQMSDVAPGIFFALFGATILVVSLFRPMSFESTDGGRYGGEATTSQAPAGESRDSRFRGVASGKRVNPALNDNKN